MANELELQKDIDAAIAALPTAVQKLIANDDWKPWVAEVVKRNNLNLDQGTVLETEVFMLMIGASNVTEMRKHLKEEARIGETELVKIISDVNELILDPLKKQLIDETTVKTAPGPIASKVEPKAPLQNQIPVMTRTVSSPTQESLVIKKLEPTNNLNQASVPGLLNKNSVYDAQRGIFIPAPSVSSNANLGGNSNNILETKLGATVTSTVKPEDVKVTTPDSGHQIGAVTPIVPTAPKPVSLDPYKEPIE